MEENPQTDFGGKTMAGICLNLRYLYIGRSQEPISH
jgi:hypothetical protein